MHHGVYQRTFHGGKQNFQPQVYSLINLRSPCTATTHSETLKISCLRSRHSHSRKKHGFQWQHLPRYAILRPQSQSNIESILTCAMCTHTQAHRQSRRRTTDKNKWNERTTKTHSSSTRQSPIFNYKTKLLTTNTHRKRTQSPQESCSRYPTQTHNQHKYSSKHTRTNTTKKHLQTHAKTPRANALTIKHRRRGHAEPET